MEVSKVIFAIILLLTHFLFLFSCRHFVFPMLLSIFYMWYSKQKEFPNASVLHVITISCIHLCVLRRYAMFLYLLLFMKAKYLLTTVVVNFNHPRD